MNRINYNRNLEKDIENSKANTTGMIKDMILLEVCLGIICTALLKNIKEQELLEAVKTYWTVAGATTIGASLLYIKNMLSKKEEALRALENFTYIRLGSRGICVPLANLQESEITKTVDIHMGKNVRLTLNKRFWFLDRNNQEQMIEQKISSTPTQTTTTYELYDQESLNEIKDKPVHLKLTK